LTVRESGIYIFRFDREPALERSKEMLFTRVIQTQTDTGDCDVKYYESLAQGVKAVKTAILKNPEEVASGRTEFEIREMDVRVTCANFVRAVKGGFDEFKTADHSGLVAGILDAIVAEKAEKAAKKAETEKATKKAEKATAKK